jgi:hypothetical protein
MAAPHDQPERRAWLEWLRAGARSAAPINSSMPFSTADLIDDGALPGWMRSGRHDANDANPSQPHPTLRPASLPGPNTDDSARGINAQSLIDEQALPSWMHENKQTTGPIPPGGIAASSLVQPDAAPDWMKSLQSTPAAGPATPATPPGQALPPGQYMQQPAAPVENKARGFSAGDLIDQQALPSWMRGQDAQSGTPDRGQVAPANLSPSFDVNALSPWAQGNGYQRSGGFAPAQQAVPPVSNAPARPAAPIQGPVMQQSPVWQPPAPQQPMGAQNAPGMGNNLSASSFIDPNALPEWLRSAGSQTAQPQGPGTYAGPPRVDNVRVPSRPRGEVNPNQGNEAAANVFASMLGVASSAPNFTGAPYGAPGGQPAPMSGNLPYPQQAPAGFGNGSYGSNNPGPQGGYQSGNAGPQAGYAMGNMGPQGGYQTGNLGQPGGYPLGNAQANPYAPGGMPPMQNGVSMPGGPVGADARPSEKPAKKGFFETIRDWFR